MKKAISMKENLLYIAGAGLLAFIVFLRVWRLDSLPLGLHIDEAGLGLNAWSIANFGYDRHNNYMPVLPLNFYSEQSAFYTYSCALLVKCFGLNMYTLRLPGVIMGVAAVVFGALIMREKWGRKGFFTGLILLGIFPYYIMNCRFALDCNVMLGMLTIALYALIRVVKRAEREPERKLYGAFLLVGVLFGLVLYTYIIAAVAVAVFGLLFGASWLLCCEEGRGRRMRQLFMFVLPMLVMAVPLALVFCVNYFGLETIRTPFFSAPKMFVNRTREVGLSFKTLPDKLKGLMHVLTSDGKYGSSDRYWTMYWWSVPLAVSGGICSLREALEGRRSGTGQACEKWIDRLMIFLAISEVILFLLCGQYNYHINGIYIALAYFCINGIFKCRLKGAAAVALICLYAGTFAGFAAEYYGEEPQDVYQVFGGAREALSLLPKSRKAREIYILDEVGEIYFLSDPIPPAKFAAVCDDMGYVKDYRNLHFYLPESFGEQDVFVCNKSSGSVGILSDRERTGQDYSVLETEHYCVFYRE